MPDTRLYVVAYDIPSNRRRAKVHKILEGLGKWTQYSLFELFLSDKELVLLQTRLEKQIDPEKDSLRFYPLCAACIKQVETIGSPPPKETTVYIS